MKYLIENNNCKDTKSNCKLRKKSEVVQKNELAVARRKNEILKKTPEETAECVSLKEYLNNPQYQTKKKQQVELVNIKYILSDSYTRVSCETWI